MPSKANTLSFFWSFLVGALGLLLVVNGLQTYQSLQVLNVNAIRSGDTNRILQLAGNTYLAIQDAELNLRDYMSGEGDEGLDEYSQAVAKVQMLITELQLLSSEIPLRQGRFDELLEVINTHNSALKAAANRQREAQLRIDQPATTDADINLLDTQSERQEVVSLSRIMAASQESLMVLAELINTIETEEKNNIQGIISESAQQRTEVSQAMLFANCLGLGFIVIIVMLTIRSSRQQKKYALLLEGKVKERTQELELYAIELRRSNRELQSFAFVASHDLQEPLRKIRAFGDRLSDLYSESLGDGKDYVVRMQNAASRMSKLIEDLLAFSRVSSRRKPFVQVDLNTILSNVLDDLQFKIEETQAHISSDDLPTVMADSSQISQLFLNVIGNALKFVKAGTVPVIHITTKEAILSVPSIDAENERSYQPAIEISVQDNGIGFDERYLDKIFNAFQRLHNRDEYDGTGIGLAICRKIVEQHGGSISASSAPDSGAKFTVILPLEQTDAALLSQGALGLQSTNSSLFDSSPNEN